LPETNKITLPATVQEAVDMEKYTRIDFILLLSSNNIDALIFLHDFIGTPFHVCSVIRIRGKSRRMISLIHYHELRDVIPYKKCKLN
jgi:hypothetical protein